MKYKEVYLALNQRKLDAPGFHYSDYSGWKAANQSYMTRQRPLWIVAEDPAAGRTDVDLPRRLCVECHQSRKMN